MPIWRSLFFTLCVPASSKVLLRLKWSRPDASLYTSLIQGLAAALKVSDALKLIDCICRVGVSPSQEVPFGKVRGCPTCMIAVAAARPQRGIQIASCAECRYQYELVSGDITRIDSEAIRAKHGNDEMWRDQWNWAGKNPYGYGSSDRQ